MVNFSIFLQLNLSNFWLNCVEDPAVTKFVKEIKFEWVCSELGSKNCFQRQLLTKYLRLTLVFVRNSALPEKFSFCFLRNFCYY